MGVPYKIKLFSVAVSLRSDVSCDLSSYPHCDDPYTCPLHDHCWSFLPEQSVLDLYRGTKKGFGLLERGTTHLRDIPDGFKLTANQVVQRQAAVTGQAHVSPQAISEFLDRLQHPLQSVGARILS